MWKKLSIFLAVFLLAVSSLWCYPSWVYGKKTTEETATAVPEEVTAAAQELTATEPAQTAMATEPVAEKSTEPETPENCSTVVSESLSETLKEQGESLTNSLTDSRVKAAAVTQVSEYIDNAVAGVEVMEQAYELEVANHKDTEERYNQLANRKFEKDFYVTVNPFVTYSPFSKGWGLGLNTVYTFKGYGISLGVYKPNLDFKTYTDITVSAGLAITF